MKVRHVTVAAGPDLNLATTGRNADSKSPNRLSETWFVVTFLEIELNLKLLIKITSDSYDPKNKSRVFAERAFQGDGDQHSTELQSGGSVTALIREIGQILRPRGNGPEALS